MKKLISVIVVFAMLFSCSVAFADSKTSDNVEEVLVRVKSKVDIPESLTEFSSYVTERDEESFYHFDWNDESYDNSVTITSDSEGRIESYHNYRGDTQDKKFSSFSKKEIENFAMMFIMKALPETTRGEGDVLVYDPESYNAQGDMRYSMQFNRMKELVKVKDNYAHITIGEDDGELFVRSFSASYDYDTDFSKESGVLENYIEKYKEAFPVELVYRNEYEYDYKTRKSTITPKLVYRVKDHNIGYISAVTGEVVTEDIGDSELYKYDAPETEDSLTAGGATYDEVLTPQEVEEIEKIEKLVSVEKIAQTVKKLPYVKFDDSLKLETSSLSKNDKGKYIYMLTYENDDDEDYRYFSIDADAESGKILSFYSNSKYAEAELTEAQVKSAKDKISEFLKSAAGSEISQCEEKEASVHYRNVTRYFVRTVNGVKHVDNGVTVTFDAVNNCVTNFNLNFADAEFENPEKAISTDLAYEKIMEYAPIIPLYIISGGEFKKVYSLDGYAIELDALTGEKKDEYSTEPQNYSYTDISGHWVEDAATKLSEIQVGFAGDELKPSQPVTQKEFLAFLASGVFSKYYAQYTEDELYQDLIEEGIVKEAEKSPESPVTREDAFVFLIRFMNLEKVAQLSDIYKVTYEDGHLLSEGKLGYAAILSGMEIICGNGGKLRPTDTVTRAEAITMLYKYLVNE